jgi:hypothetical protein
MAVLDPRSTPSPIIPPHPRLAWVCDDRGAQPPAAAGFRSRRLRAMSRDHGDPYPSPHPSTRIPNGLYDPIPRPPKLAWVSAALWHRHSCLCIPQKLVERSRPRLRVFRSWRLRAMSRNPATPRAPPPPYSSQVIPDWRRFQRINRSCWQPAAKLQLLLFSIGREIVKFTISSPQSQAQNRAMVPKKKVNLNKKVSCRKHSAKCQGAWRN